MASYADPAPHGGRPQAFLTGLFLVLGVVLINLPPGVQQEVRWIVQASVLRPFVWVQEALDRARDQAVDIASLRAQRDSLVASSITRTHLREENRRLRGLLSLSERIGPTWVAASVIRAGTMGSASMFRIHVGADRGVRENAPVVTRHGLVGLIREVRAASALGMDWTHPDFRASAMSMDGETYGFVETRRGAFREEDRLEFTGTAFSTLLDSGTVVLTSGRGGVYPRGIPVGRVVGVAGEDAGWSRSYWLEPFVDPGSVTHVLVAAGPGGVPDDVSAAWPADSIRTAAELRRLEEVRVDSLAILRDSVARLREMLGDTVPPRDSAGAPDPGAPTDAGGPPGGGPPPDTGTASGGGGVGTGGA